MCRFKLGNDVWSVPERGSAPSAGHDIHIEQNMSKGRL